MIINKHDIFHWVCPCVTLDYIITDIYIGSCGNTYTVWHDYKDSNIGNCVNSSYPMVTLLGDIVNNRCFMFKKYGQPSFTLNKHTLT